MAGATGEAEAMTAGTTTHLPLPPALTCHRMLDLMKKVGQPRFFRSSPEAVSAR